MSMNWSKSDLPQYLKKMKIPYSQVREGDIIVDTEHGYPWQVAMIVNDGKRIGLLDKDDNGIFCSLKKDFVITIIDRSCLEDC